MMNPCSSSIKVVVGLSMIICQYQVSAKPGIALGLLAGATAQLECDKGAR